MQFAKKKKRFLLAAVNAKYIHSNLAVYSLTAYAAANGAGAEYAEYTINHQMEEVLCDLYERKPDVIGFSCYIWNMDFVKELAEEFHKVMPHVPIWLGGPEVSWNPGERLLEMPFVTGIMIGEGEQTFAELTSFYEREDFGGDLREIAGLCLRGEDKNPFYTAKREILPMDELVFPYRNLSEYTNRIIYYESSRGCPFSCSYCLSSIDKKLRFRSLELVFRELQFFLDEKVSQVKFVDRTFNCRHEHSRAVWQYILDHDNGVTNFHFEIAADLLQEEDFALFDRMRSGLIQLEIGVQTTNPKTIQAIGRKMDLEKVARCTERVRKGHNIHQHLDLIAGLPFEGLESFEQSFNEVYAMKPDQLQLGFLKVLHGTRMEKEKKEYDLVYRSHPAYEVLQTRWLSYGDILQLKNVEETVEEYYNSGQFTFTLAYVVPQFDTPFAFYRQFGAFLREKGYRKVSQNRVGRYMALRAFLKETCFDKSLTDMLLSYDFCLREKLNRVPEFIPDQEPYKKQISDFFAREMHEGAWLGEEAKNSSYRQLRGRFQPLVLQENIREFVDRAGEKDTKETQLCDKIQKGPWLVLFDYDKRSVMDHNAKIVWIPFEQLKREMDER